MSMSRQALRQKLIDNGTTTVDQAAQLDDNLLYILNEYQPIRDLITNGAMTVDQAAQLDGNQLFMLANSQPLRDLITNGAMTVDQAVCIPA